MKKIEFIKPVYDLNEISKLSLPTVVLCGRSNVGKSSFINSLFNTKIAKTSSLPGKTRSINYYLIQKKFYIVDLPGFGYAKVSKDERNSWQKLLQKYFVLNKNISLAVHLIDSRHEPMALDVELNNFLHKQNIPFIVILNKADKLNQAETAQAKKQIIKFFPELLLNENLFFYSSVKTTGQKEVTKILNALFLM
jgi:GTP-binding protein